MSDDLAGQATHLPVEGTAAPLGADSAGTTPPERAAAQGPAEPQHAEPQHAAESAPTAESQPASGDSSANQSSPVELHAAETPAADDVDDDSGPIEEIPQIDEPPKLNWYILKVQSNREESIREGLQRRVSMAGLEKYFSEIIVPTEMVTEFKAGKKRVVKRKLYPGYLVVNMEINDDTWFLVRETPGIGDFTGSAGKPTPMSPNEVSKIIAKQEEKSQEAPKLKIAFNVGDRVKITEGTFENFEGTVDAIEEASGRVTVMINIFGRSTPVELEYWQIEAI